MFRSYFKKILNRCVFKEPAACGGYGLLLLMVFMASVVMVGTSLQLMTGVGTLGYLGKSSQANLAAQELASTAMATVTAYVQTQLNSNSTVNTSYFSSPTTMTMPADPTALGGGTVTLGTYTATITSRGDSYLLRVTGTVGSVSAAVASVVNVARNGYLLDAMSNANVAFGLRKLRSVYSGSAIRVRRAIDDTQQDIGFLPNGDLDIYSLSDFLLSSSTDTTHSRAPLNTISPSATVAFGLRALQKDYTGNLIRVRRSSDSTTLDVGMDANGDLDVNAILAFVGTGTGYVTIWYDQSGNNTNATQVTAGSQPTIVTSGVLNMVNNRPAILYDGIDDALAFSRTVSTDFSILACFSTIAGQNWSGADDAWGSPFFAGLIDADATGTNSQDFGITIDQSGKPHMGTGGDTDTALTLPTPGSQNDGRVHWLAYIRSNTTAMFTGYTETASYAKFGSAGSLNGSSGITLGQTRTTSLSFSGYIGEVLVYNSVLSDADRLTLARNQAFYYNMAVQTIPTTSAPLDSVGSAVAACGLRKLSGGYGGSAIQVRSSAGGTQNIGFTTAGDLDIAALLSFVGSNSGYVTTCYDQSGNNRNLTQGTSGNQPRIVNAGVLDTLNGKPAMYFDGGDYLTYTGTAFVTGSNASALVMFSASASSPAYSRVLVGYRTGSADWQATDSAAFIEASGNNLKSERNSSGSSTISFTYGSPVLGTAIFDGVNGGYLYMNGAQGSTGGPTGTFSIQNLRLGSSTALNSNEYLIGYIGEAYLYSSVLSATNRQTLEKNILQYFSAPLAAGYVTTWYDQSGNGYNATQSNAYLQPTIDLPRYGAGNTRPTVTFNGKQRLITTGGMPTSANYTKSVVFSYFSNSDYNNIISSNGGHGLYSAGTNFWRMWHTGDFATSNTATSMNTQYSINASFTQSSMTGNLYQGNVLVGTGTSPSSATNAEIYLGSWGTQSPLNGTISEALVFNRVLSTLDRTTIYDDQCDYYGAQ